MEALLNGSTAFGWISHCPTFRTQQPSPVNSPGEVTEYRPARRRRWAGPGLRIRPSRPSSRPSGLTALIPSHPVPSLRTHLSSRPAPPRSRPASRGAGLSRVSRGHVWAVTWPPAGAGSARGVRSAPWRRPRRSLPLTGRSRRHRCSLGPSAQPSWASLHDATRRFPCLRGGWFWPCMDGPCCSPEAWCHLDGHSGFARGLVPS